MTLHSTFFTDIEEKPPTIITDDVEELRPLMYNGIEYPEYSVSNWGNIYSHKNGRTFDRRRKKLLRMMNIGGAVNGYGAKSVIHLSSGGKSINVLVDS